MKGIPSMKDKPKGGSAPEHKNKRRLGVPVFVAGAVVLAAFLCLFILYFYQSLEREIYTERTTYLKEISEQTVYTTDAISAAQWDLAAIFAAQLGEEPISTSEELASFIGREEQAFAQQGLSLLVFDEAGNYYDSSGNRARWLGSISSMGAAAPKKQVEITTLPTTEGDADEMVFLLRLDGRLAAGDGLSFSHVAVVRDMEVFREAFQVSTFGGQGESYIVSSLGTRVYRGQADSTVIGDIYNVLGPLKQMNFQYGGTYEELRQAVTDGKNLSLEFSDDDGARYYITASPMETNGWSLLGILPADIVSARMRGFMNKALFGVGGIALTMILAISITVIFVMRFKSSQRLMRQQAEANEALQEAAEKAEAASRAKTVFLSHMSHDIRTPINGIMGMADIATRNREDDRRVTDCLGKITSASQHLLGLVNDVLDMSRIESGKVQLEDKPFYAEALLDGCYSVVAGQAQKNGLSLKRDFSGVTKALLRGDELHLRQIFINILGNAVKFTPEGGEVCFTAREEVKEDGLAALTVVIRDTGIGMSPEFQEKLFEPFSQEEDGDRSQYKGTGLGMSIVKQLLELMGGDIEVDSAPGQGSTFTVRLSLPIEAAPEEETQQNEAGEADLTGMRVLLAEDNELNMEIAKYVLEECGVSVTCAWNGKEALEAFRQQPAGSFDVILMDIMMPVMNGLDAARAIRADGKGDSDSVPIVAMTANAYAEDRKAALDAGMNRHLAKPIERDELLRTLQELYTERRGLGR